MKSLRCFLDSLTFPLFQYIQKSIKIILILMLLSCSWGSYSQTTFSFTTLHKSEGIKPNKKNIYKEGILVGENGYYILRLTDYINRFDIEQGKYQILHFDKDLELNQIKDLNIKFKIGAQISSGDTEVKFTTILNNELLVFVLEKSRKEKKKQISVHTFDLINLEEKGTPKVVFESAFEGIGKNQNKLNLVLSPDSTKILIYEVNPVRALKTELNIIVIDKNLETLWQSNITGEEINNKHLSAYRGIVNDKGEAFILFSKGKSNVQILKFDSTGFEEIFVREKQADKRMLNLKIDFDKNQNIVLMGFYSKTKNRSAGGIVQIVNTKTDGTYYLKATYSAFSEDLIRLNTKKGHKRKKLPKMEGYIVRELFQKSNDNWVFIGEETYTEQPSESPNDYNTRWYHRNILVAELDSDGEIIRVKKIPKHGENKKVNYDKNFYTHHIKNNLLLFYNDNSKNMNYPGHGSIKQPYKPYQVSVAHISNNGVLKTAALYSKEKDDIRNFNPRLVAKLSEEEVIFFIKEGKKEKLIKVRIEG